MRSLLLLVLPLAVLTNGCTALDQNGCTSEFRVHQIEIERNVTTSSQAQDLQVEACFLNDCKIATPSATGDLDFKKDLGSFGATDGSLKSSRVLVRYAIGEGQTDSLRLRVKTKSGETVLDESAKVQWEDGDCHPPPKSTKL